MVKKQYKIIAISGFARVATLLARVSYKFSTKVFLEYEKKTVELINTPDSIMSVMELEIKHGSEIHLWVEGINEEDDLNKIEMCLRINKII